MPYQQYQPYGADPLTAPGPTPAQIQQQREIASLLMNPANGMQPIHANNTAYFSPWMGVSNIARQLMGDVRTGYANRLQQQMQGQYGQQYGEAIRQSNPNAGSFSGAPSNTSGAVQGNNSGEPRGIRNNNPGNIEDSAFARAQPGYSGSDGRFAIFDSAKSGEAAMDKLLTSYGNRGFDTTAAVVNRWAPPSENDSNFYAATVAKQLGVSPDTKLDMSNPALRAALASGMAGVENGRPYQVRPQGPQMAQGSGAINPALLGAIEANPAASEATKGALRGFAVPQPTADVYGQPGVGSMQGGMRPLPVQPGFQPGFRAPVTVGPDGGISSTVVTPSPGAGGQVPSFRKQVEDIYQTGQEFAASSAANKAVRGGIEDDVKFVQAAVPIMQNLELITNEVNKHGDKMIFGPSADLVTNIRKVVAQHAPGLMTDDDIKGLAAQDSLRKQVAFLQTAIGRQTGNTDMSLLQGHASVPGEHNSKEGLLAVADMLKQQVGLRSRFVMENLQNYGRPGFNPIQAQADFYSKNPIINPLTKNPIKVDLAKGEKVSPTQVEFKKLSDDELKKRLGIP